MIINCSLIVRIKSSTIPVALWSITGLKITLTFPVLYFRCNPCRVVHFLRKLTTDLADVLDVFCAEANVENRSTHTSICIMFPKLKVAGRQSLTLFLDLDLRPMGAFRDLRVLKEVSNFYLLQRYRYSSFRELLIVSCQQGFSVNFRPPDVKGCQNFHCELVRISFM